MSADEEYNPLTGLVPATGWARRRRDARQQRRWGAATWHRVAKAVTRASGGPRTVLTLCGRVLQYVEVTPDRPHENRFCHECMNRWTKEGGTDAAGVA